MYITIFLKSTLSIFKIYGIYILNYIEYYPMKCEYYIYYPIKLRTITSRTGKNTQSMTLSQSLIKLEIREPHR